MKTLLKIIIGLIAIVSLNASTKINSKTYIYDLKCEYLKNPLGIDVTSPRLSWKIKTDKKNFKQKAYRILVATEKEKLNKDIGNLWDTGITNTNKSVQIKYAGKKLKSRQKVYWKVKVWDQIDNESNWSEVATWEMALISKTDWKAKWIGIDEDKIFEVGKKNPAPYFRKVFSIKNNVKDARIYISGLGYYELYINGKRVGNHVLSPNQTNYDRRQKTSYENGKIANMSTRVLYVTYDITGYLQKGRNVISVILGNGWYYQTERKEYLPLTFDTPRFISQIEILHDDNKKKTILSDETWKVSNGPILDNNIYLGEIYDARLEESGWNNINYDDRKWKYAKVVRSPQGKLYAQMSPPDRVIARIKPVKITIPQKGIYRYDFGTMFSGWVKLTVKGERGTKLKLKYFEDSGNTYGQTDTYILKGTGIEEWHQRFTWHAFRYVEVSGSSNPLTLKNLEGEIIHADVESTGSFKSSNKLFNRILKDYRKTQLDNMHGGVPTDCPHRERRGYTGDGQIAAQAAIYNFDMSAFYTKWLNDISDAQNKVTGYVPNTVPYHSGGGGVAWGSAYIIIPWYMYLYYGDVSILKKHYNGMKKYIQYLNNRTDKDGLIYIAPDDYWDLGEWVPPVPTIIPKEFVASSYYFYDLKLMLNISKILNKKNDTKEFQNISDKVKKSFNERYFHKKNYNYSIGYQGANVFPLAFNLVPKKYERKVFNNLVQNIAVKNKGHFDTGMMATPYLLEVLTKYGRSDLAYTLMNRRDYPSYGYNIERGATTLWETWQGNESHSHPMFGSVTAWFYQNLGGINPDENKPGFKHIIIKPELIKDLGFVNTTYKSIYGEIKSNWQVKNDSLKLNIKIPPNTTATVLLPAIGKDNIICNSIEAKMIGKENNSYRYEVPSGNYTFISHNISSLLKTPMLSIPQIIPTDTTLFNGDSVKVNIIQYSKDAEIRYTLDGTELDEQSKLFTNPFGIKNNITIKARTYKKGFQPSFISTSRIVFVDSLLNGVKYKFYKGAWKKLPDFKKLQPDMEGKIYNFNLEKLRNYADKFAVEFLSKIVINKNDDYTFYLMSNDGSKLFIDEKLVIDFDGLHGSLTKSGKIRLARGKHKIKVEYFQAGGGLGLEVLYESDQMERQIIPANTLFIE